jgi:hypothetical protein
MDEQHRKVWKSTPHLLIDSGASITRRPGRASKHNRAKNIAGEKLRRQYVYFEPIPEKFQL